MPDIDKFIKENLPSKQLQDAWWNDGFDAYFNGDERSEKHPKLPNNFIAGQCFWGGYSWAQDYRGAL